MTAAEVLRVMRLCHRFGVTPQQAAVLAGLAYGEGRE